METTAIRRLRGFLRICFGYFTLIFLAASIFSVRSLFWTHNRPYTWSSHTDRQLTSIALLALSYFVRIIPILMAVIYGTAWWTLKHGRQSARNWAVAASILMLLFTAFIAARVFFRSNARVHSHIGYFLFPAFLFAVGILGLITFSRMAREDIQFDAKKRHLRGDGTSAFLDLMVSGFALTGVWGGIILYTRWGHAHQLPFIRGSVSWAIILLVIFITVFLHELAHASVGLTLGMKLRSFVIGPFQWRIRDGRWTYRFVPAGFLSFAGSIGIIPANLNQSRWVEIGMIAAGPLANLITGLLMVLLTLSAKGQRWERFWEPVAFFALVNIITFAVNLIPIRPETLYSDGARIFQLLSNGTWAELHRVVSMVVSSTVTPLRPRDYDVHAIQRGAAHFRQGREALMLRLFATSHYLDQKQISEARASFAEAASIARDSRTDISPDLLATCVFNAVYLDRDAISARRYWDLFERKAPDFLGVDYWLARSALHFIEDHPCEARDAWTIGAALARNLPNAGAFEFDRDRYQFMRDLLNSDPHDDSDRSLSSMRRHSLP